MGNMSERQRCVKARKTPGAWVITLDDASWAALMVALGVAIAHSDGDWAATWRRLRTALSTVEGEDERGPEGSTQGTITERRVQVNDGWGQESTVSASGVAQA